MPLKQVQRPELLYVLKHVFLDVDAEVAGAETGTERAAADTEAIT